MGEVDSAGNVGRARELPLSLPFAAETYSVSDLCFELRDLLAEAFDSVWVAGEVHRVRQSRGGHLYFELVEKGARDEIVGKLEAVVWRRDLQRIRRLLASEGLEIGEGQEIRCRANVDFYPPFGRTQLAVREVDPVFALGQLARRRRETLAALTAAGLLERNRGLRLPALPLRLALVTSVGSAAYHDFLSTLGESPYGFEVLVIHAAVQGLAAERELARALGSLAALDLDCVALVRGGGARTDLAAFDSRPVAEAVARAPVPVLTGLGHQTDQTLADLVAHTALKTPTKVAELVVGRVREAEGALDTLATAIRSESRSLLERARGLVERAERGFRGAAFRVESEERALEELRRRLAEAAARSVDRKSTRLAVTGERLGAAAPRRLRRLALESRQLHERLALAARGTLARARLRLEERERLCRGLSPEKTLARGFTITRDAGGAIVKSAAALAAGDRLDIEFRDGRVAGRVEGR